MAKWLKKMCNGDICCFNNTIKKKRNVQLSGLQKLFILRNFKNVLR